MYFFFLGRKNLRFNHGSGFGTLLFIHFAGCGFIILGKHIFDFSDSFRPNNIHGIRIFISRFRIHFLLNTIIQNFRFIGYGFNQGLFDNRGFIGTFQ